MICLANSSDSDSIVFDADVDEQHDDAEHYGHHEYDNYHQDVYATETKSVIVSAALKCFCPATMAKRAALRCP